MTKQKIDGAARNNHIIKDWRIITEVFTTLLLRHVGRNVLTKDKYSTQKMKKKHLCVHIFLMWKGGTYILYLFILLHTVYINNGFKKSWFSNILSLSCFWHTTILQKMGTIIIFWNLQNWDHLWDAIKITRKKPKKNLCKDSSRLRRM